MSCVDVDVDVDVFVHVHVWMWQRASVVLSRARVHPLPYRIHLAVWLWHGRVHVL